MLRQAGTIPREYYKAFNFIRKISEVGAGPDPVFKMPDTTPPGIPTDLYHQIINETALAYVGYYQRANAKLKEEARNSLIGDPINDVVPSTEATDSTRTDSDRSIAKLGY
jgi:hypothetical protein